MNRVIKELGDSVQKRKITWQQAANIINKQFSIELSSEALRKKYERLPKDMESFDEEELTLYGDGSVEPRVIVNLSKEEKSSPEKVLAKMGYDIRNWKLEKLQISAYQQHTKEQTTKDMYAVKARLIPINKTELTPEECAQIAQTIFQQAITPLKIKECTSKELDDDKLMEDPGIELHLGKMAWEGDTGQNYDKNIAIARFNDILSNRVRLQEREKCGKLLVLVGNDFFNSDNVDATTTKGTPQTNDLRWKKMFIIGLELYKKYFDTLIPMFHDIEVRLVEGNHDKMASFYLYQSLKQAYGKQANFSDNYKEVQCCQFGDVAIFFSHGDVKGKQGLDRLIRSIPTEFYKEWGTSKFRELHLAHLHSEHVVDDESGMITRRNGAPTGTDQWHYEERYFSTQKQQTYIWHKYDGLLDINYHNFRPGEEFSKILRR